MTRNLFCMISVEKILFLTKPKAIQIKRIFHLAPFQLACTQFSVIRRANQFIRAG